MKTQEVTTDMYSNQVPTRKLPSTQLTVAKESRMKHLDSATNICHSITSERMAPIAIESDNVSGTVEC